MAGTKAGAAKAVKTCMAKHGKDFYKLIGAKGGRNGHTGGFASMSPERRSECGRKGGRISRRGKARNYEDEDF